jgi:parallel beta-helix repeat protein
MRQTLLILTLVATSAVSAANLRITTIAPAQVDPDHPVTWSFTIQNVSGEPLPEAPLYLQFSPGRIVSTLPSQLSCVDQIGYSNCTLPALAPGQSLDLSVAVQHPFVHGRVFSYLSASYVRGLPESATRSTAFWREYPVTTTADSGPGSLRQTILDINAACLFQTPNPVPCKAAFRITDPVPAAGWHTVKPLTPLPAVTAYDAATDGSTQVKTNPDGPSVSLDGSALFSGDGITGDEIIMGNRVEVSGLAIGSFPGNGVYGGNGTFLHVHDCYIGVDPTGRQATPNGSRGVAASRMIGLIENNVIGGNVRSGVFFMGTPTTGPTIRGNRIGVAAHDDTPIGNGASGIFVADFWGYYTYPTIEENVIANNAIGIALSANAPMIILGNTIRNNAQSGIDIGLDGPTESAPGIPGVHGGIISPPVILSAEYQDGITTIRGYSLAADRRQVLLYANTTLDPGGYAEGEQYLGITPLQYGEDTAFTFQYAGDLRGKYINGSSYGVTFWGYDELSYTSSEFGRARAVEGDSRKRRRAVR